MLKKLLLTNLVSLSPYKYWILLLSLLIVGVSYLYVDKSSEYVSGVEFVNYGDIDFFSLEVGNEVIFNGNTRILDEQFINAIYVYAQRRNNDKFINIATSKNCIYQFLLDKTIIEGQSIIIGNHLLDLLQFKEVARLTHRDISKLSRQEKLTLKMLYNIIFGSTTINGLEEFGNFTLVTKSKNKSFVNFLPSAYYRHLINFLESEETEKLLKDYEFYKNKNRSAEKLFMTKEKQFLALEDKYKTVKDQSELVSFQIFEENMNLLAEELDRSQAYYNDITQRVDQRASQFYLINQLFIPIEYKTPWVKKFLFLTVISLLFCYAVLIVIGLFRALNIKALWMECV